MTTSSSRSFWRNRGCLISAAVAILIVAGIIWFYLSIYQGRGISRWTGIPVKVTLPECVTAMDQVVSISFHKDTDGETIKDVTYKCDGRLLSREYNDFGILQGEVEWVLDR
jgi:hypothetical protein